MVVRQPRVRQQKRAGNTHIQSTNNAETTHVLRIRRRCVLEMKGTLVTDEQLAVGHAGPLTRCDRRDHRHPPSSSPGQRIRSICSNENDIVKKPQSDCTLRRNLTFARAERTSAIRSPHAYHSQSLHNDNSYPSAEYRPSALRNQFYVPTGSNTTRKPGCSSPSQLYRAAFLCRVFTPSTPRLKCEYETLSPSYRVVSSLHANRQQLGVCPAYASLSLGTRFAHAWHKRLIEI